MTFDSKAHVPLLCCHLGIKTEKGKTSRLARIRYLCFQSNKLRFW